MQMHNECAHTAAVRLVCAVRVSEVAEIHIYYCYLYLSSTAVGWNTKQKPLSRCRFFSELSCRRILLFFTLFTLASSAQRPIRIQIVFSIIKSFRLVFVFLLHDRASASRSVICLLLSAAKQIHIYLFKTIFNHFDSNYYYFFDFSLTSPTSMLFDWDWLASLVSNVRPTVERRRLKFNHLMIENQHFGNWRR